VSRPSRTQQLLNPKLVPQLNSDVPQDLLRKKGVADEQLAKLELERGQKRERESELPEPTAAAKRQRSASFLSSTSVSTISTNLSRSPSPRQDRSQPSRLIRTSRSPDLNLRHHVHSRMSRSPTTRATQYESDRKRRRGSCSSESFSSDEEQHYRGSHRDYIDSRSTRRRFKELSPPSRGRSTESRDPDRGRRRPSNTRRREFRLERDRVRDGERARGVEPPKENRPPAKERSLSPFSKRLALTQAMNTGR